MKKKAIQTHFILETRKRIEEDLNNGFSITEIANDIKRDRSNVAREIKKHKTYVFPSTFNNRHPCLKYDTCKVKCFDCYKYCKNIEFNLCDKLNSSPHTCNKCNKKSGCRYVKIYYKAMEAENEYNNNLKECRKGLHYTEKELDILNNDFRTLVLNTKSIYHSIIVINKRGFNFKSATIYKQIERNQLLLKSYELPRYRKSKCNKVKKDKSYKREDIKGHTYEDYEEYKRKNINDIEVQMDTVEGIIENNAPALLTLEIVEIKFIFIFKLDSKSQDEVNEKIKNLAKIFGKELTTKIFKILLTDNGSEFIDIDKLTEILPNSNIFYCHPYSSYEKGNIENNHELIRRVIPKGISLKAYTEQDIEKLCCHVNSLYRESLNGKCPFDLIENYISKDILNKLHLKKIDDDKVNLTPYLLSAKNIDNIKKYLDEKEIKERNILL